MRTVKTSRTVGDSKAPKSRAKSSRVPRRASKRRQSAAATPTEPVDINALIHPELREGTQAALEFFQTIPPLCDATIGDFRAAMGQFAKPHSDDIPVAQKHVAASRVHKIPVCVINARRDGVKRPAILHIHGGGFVAGSALYEVRTQQDIAAALDCVVVSVDYRLAPEAGWRKSLEDNYAALKWLYKNAARLGVDRKRIAVMGESAGGGHAALLAFEARNRGEVRLVLQVLVYPMLDDRTGSTRKAAAHVGTMIWTRESNVYGWRSFLGTKPGGRDVPVHAVPARHVDLAGLAPAFIGVGDLDLFVDEDIDYARRLAGAGVPTELHVVPGAVHGFDEFAPDASIVRQFVRMKLDALRRAFQITIS